MGRCHQFIPTCTYLFKLKINVLVKRHLSHVMGNPTFAICQQQRCRSACTSAQFVVRCLDSTIPLLSKFKIPNLYLASVAEQASLSLTWSQTLKTGFLVTRLILCSVCCHQSLVALTRWTKLVCTKLIHSGYVLSWCTPSCIQAVDLFDMFLLITLRMLQCFCILK